MRYAYAVNTKGLKSGSVYTLNREYALNNGVRLTTRVYGTLNNQGVGQNITREKKFL